MTTTVQVYSCDKVAEGGSVSQKDALHHIRKVMGLKAEPASSPYVGQYGIRVWANAAQHDKVEEFLFGEGGQR